MLLTQAILSNHTNSSTVPSPEPDVDSHVIPNASTLPSAPTRNWAGEYSLKGPRGLVSDWGYIIQDSPATCSNSLNVGHVASVLVAVSEIPDRVVESGAASSSVKFR